MGDVKGTDGSLSHKNMKGDFPPVHIHHHEGEARSTPKQDRPRGLGAVDRFKRGISLSTEEKKSLRVETFRKSSIKRRNERPKAEEILEFQRGRGRFRGGEKNTRKLLYREPQEGVTARSRPKKGPYHP